MQQSLIELPLPKSGKITHIYQCGDIHIRRGDQNKARKNEYLTVFDNFFNMLVKSEPIINQTAVIVVTGDIFHEKDVFHSSTIEMFHYFVSGLAKLAPTYLIQGNHDFRSDAASESDSIKCNTLVPRDNLVYLEHTGIYTAGNIGFGLVAEHDVLDPSTTSGKLVDELPVFPSPSSFPKHVEHKFALFHGTIKNCKLDNYSSSNDGYPLEWFGKYDAILVGHIHLQQFGNVKDLDTRVYQWNTEKVPFLYAGSLLQQNFGENLIGHGYLEIDIVAKTFKTYDIPNPYGMLHVKLLKESWMAKIHNEWRPLVNILRHEASPKTQLLININGGRNISGCDNLLDILNEFQGVNKYVITNKLLTNLDVDTSYEIDPEKLINNVPEYITEDFNSIQNFMEYIDLSIPDQKEEYKKIIHKPDNLLIDCTNLPESVVGVVNKRNLVLNKKLVELTKCFSRNQELSLDKPTIHLKYLKWSWMLGYGENNWYDFDLLNGQIGIVDGPNDSGKSNFMEIIYFSLFGKPFDSRSDIHNASEIICQQKPVGESATTQLIFSIGDRDFLIHRKYKPVGNTMEKKQKIYTYNNGDAILLKADTAAGKWILENIGRADQFLLSCMVTQRLDKDFFSCSQDVQKNLIESILNIDYIPFLVDYLKETQLAYKAVIENLNVLHTSIVGSTADFSTIDKQYVKCVANRDRLTKNIRIRQKQIAKIEERLKDLPSCSSLDISHPVNIINQRINDYQKLMDESVIPTGTCQNISTQIACVSQNLTPIQRFVDITLDGKTVEKLLKSLTKEIQPHSDINLVKNSIDKFKITYSEVCEKQLSELEQYHNNVKILETNIDKLTNEINIHQANFPRRPTTTISQYNSWLISNPVIESVRVDELEQFCLKNPLVKPDVSRDYIKQLQNSALRIKQNTRKSQWLICNVDEFDRQSKIVEKQVKNLTTLIKKHTKELSDLNSQIDKQENECRGYELALSKVKVFSQPKHSFKDVELWLKNYQICLDSQPFFIELKKSTEKLRKCKTDLSELESKFAVANKQSAYLAFNPNCDACKKQPWKIHLSQLQDQINEKSTELESILTNHNEMMSNPLVIGPGFDLEKSLAKFDIMNKNLALYQEYHQNHLDYNNYLEKSNPLVTKITEIKKSLLDSNKQKKSVSQNLDSLQTELKTQEVLAYDIEYCKKNRDNLVELEKQISDYTRIVVTYESILPKHQELDKTRNTMKERDNWQSELHNIKVYDKWNSDLNSMKDKKKSLEDELAVNQTHIAKLEQYKIDLQNHTNNLSELDKWTRWNNYSDFLNKLTATNLYHKINSLTQELKQLEQYNDYQNNLNLWKTVLEVKPLYETKTEMSEKISTEQEELIETEKQIAVYQIQIDQFEKNTKYKNQIASGIEILSRNNTISQELSKLAAGYKFWLYKERIIPKIVGDTNKIARMFNVGLEYQFDSNVIWNEKQINIDWLISDGRSRVRVIRRGGFRHFLFGLAFRITLARLGSLGVKCDQLFVDEGFVGADQVNLLFIPDFLRNISKIYSSVLVVSHLESLRNACELTSSIVWTNKLSRLTFGIDKTVRINDKVVKNTINDDSVISKPSEEVAEIISNRVTCTGFTAKREPCKRMPVRGTKTCTAHFRS